MTNEIPEFDSHPRRGFMAVMAGLLGAVLGLVPAGIGGLFFLGPVLRRKRDTEGAPFIDMGVSLDSLPADGQPMLATASASQVDAWNGYPNRALGSVWLRKINDQVIAFSAVCPHLGCSVEHRTSQNDFFCPCHTSAFDIDGKKTNAIPPRDMDSLEVKVDAGRVLVRYQNYRAGETKKVPV